MAPARLLFIICRYTNNVATKGKGITGKAGIGPEGPRRLRLPDFKTLGT